MAYVLLGVAMLLRGDANGALAEFQQEPVEVFRTPLAYHALGRKAESDATLARLVEKYEKDATYNIAAIHAFRRQPDRAFAWLEKERTNGGAFVEIVPDPLFAHLHGDPRWIAFLRTIGKAPEQLAKIAFKVTPPVEAGYSEAHDNSRRPIPIFQAPVAQQFASAVGSWRLRVDQILSATY